MSNATWSFTKVVVADLDAEGTWTGSLRRSVRP
jgi:hypothetical protein